ncbi:desmoglein-2.1 [Pseudorasbora parva]|uniref:desmoglein-2.1 n=1 Tax=Pseudorasbora parva TaxID=51549 RepID=UPI00351F77E1
MWTECKSFRTSDQLFICYRGQQKGKVISKQRMAHWIMDTIVLAYESQDVPCLLGVRANSTRGLASSWVLARGASLTDIYTRTPNTFAKFYSLRVEPVSSCVLNFHSQKHRRARSKCRPACIAVVVPPPTTAGANPGTLYVVLPKMLPHALAPTLLLLVTVQILSTGECWKVAQKLRHKREWVVPFKKIIENVDYSSEPYISKMRSDMDQGVPLRYTLRGPGANQPPFGCFIVDEYKGFIRITRPLDREERENYTLIGTAWFFNNTIAEDNITVNIRVEDQNDNSPVFIQPKRSRVYERSPVGTFVTQVVAKDADKPHTPHSAIAYSIIKQEPNNGVLFFAVNKSSGEISVSSPTLDREEHRNYVLTVQAADMNGEGEGNSATATVSVVILDVNDNIPTLEKDEFSVSIDENVAPIEVLKIQALDIDEERTDNWLAVFEIVSGNEDGYFTVETDPKTNMGILYLNKPADFESASHMNLNLVVSNKAVPGAPLGSGAGAAGASIGSAGGSGAGGQYGGSGAGGAAGGSGASGQSGGSGAGGQSGASGSGAGSGSSAAKQKQYLVKVNVKNKPEPPRFQPKVKPISVSENSKSSIPRVIDTYTATEEDTGKPAEKVKYAKGYDPDNWISIDVDTAEIKLHKVPDRESPFVVNGTYYAKILCITDELHGQTSTGTIALQVEDLNDNCPKLLNNVQTVCSNTRVVNVTAEDTDSYPNGAPLKFNLIEEKTRGKWNLETINDVSASLLTEDSLWPGFYQVTMEIRDMQGLACHDEQVLHLEVCTCSEGTVCGAKVAAVSTTSATLGAAGISFLILGFLCLILVLMVLIKCECGSAEKGFIDLPFEAKQYLMSYSIEGKGNDTDVLMATPLNLNNGKGDKIKMYKDSLRMVEPNNYTMGKIQVLKSDEPVSSEMVGVVHESAFGGFYCDTDGAHSKNSARCQAEQVFSEAFFKKYYMQKTQHIEQYDFPEERFTKYDYEGERSVASSIDICSNQNESDDDLEFLNDLGLKFRTLAEVCGFEQTQSMSHADSKVENTFETTPTTTPFTEVSEVSSNHMTNTVQPSPVEITVKSPLVQTPPSQGMVIQVPMFYRVNQSMQSNVLMSEDGLGEGLYKINSIPKADRLLIQGNGHAFEPLISGQQAIIGHYSQIGPQSPVMINQGLGEVNPVVIQNHSPTPNLVMMQQQQLDGTGLLRMVNVPVGSVVSGKSGQGRVTLLDGTVNRGMVLVGGLGPSHHPMSPQSLYSVSSQDLSGPVHMNQRVIDGSLSSAQNNGQRTVTIIESLVNGGNVSVGGPGTPNLVSMPQISNGQVNRQLLISAPNIVSGEGRVSGLFVSGPSIPEGPVNSGNLLVAGPGQSPVSTNASTPHLVSLPQVAAGQVNNNQQLISGPISNVQNIVAGKGGQNRLVNGPNGPLVNDCHESRST